MTNVCTCETEPIRDGGRDVKCGRTIAHHHDHENVEVRPYSAAADVLLEAALRAQIAMAPERPPLPRSEWRRQRLVNLADQGLTAAEIGLQLGMRPGAVRVALHRARQALQISDGDLRIAA